MLLAETAAFAVSLLFKEAGPFKGVCVFCGFLDK
jgi:hypothetical protein